MEEGPGTNQHQHFSRAAFQGAEAVAERLHQSGCYRDAFWIGNTFVEIGKVLVARARDKYVGTLENLLLIGFSSFANGSFVGNKVHRPGAVGSEIESIQQGLDNLCSRALGTFFNRKTAEFWKTNQPEKAIGERAVNESIARYFDTRLRTLLDSDRPQVADYVRQNMASVYRLKLSEDWKSKREEWEGLLKTAGYDEVIRDLRAMGDLVSADEVGKLSAPLKEDVRRAQANGDLQRVYELLADSAKELRHYLYSEAQKRFEYREPPSPHLADDLRKDFGHCRRLAQTDDPKNLRKALDVATEIWENDTRNFGLRDWVAYLQAKTLNLPVAEELLAQIRKRRRAEDNFVTDWNLAVLLNERRDETEAYKLLLPLLDRNEADEDLVLVVLALSHKLGDHEQFLATVPRVMSLLFHPLAFAVAYEQKDETRQKALLGQLLQQRQGKWELPPVSERFSNVDDFFRVIDRAIVGGQRDQLVVWLQGRIRSQSSYIPNYLALARVLEEECQDVSGAFDVLKQRLEATRNQRDPDSRAIDEACRDLLELCKRSVANEPGKQQYLLLGEQAYSLAQNAGARNSLLKSFGEWEPKRDGIEKKDVLSAERSVKEQPPPKLPSDPRLAEKLAWVMAKLASIRNVASYVQETAALREFTRIVAETSPRESDTVVELIGNISTVVETFGQTPTENRDARRVLYERATGFETRLQQLLEGGALSQQLANTITPYCKALASVIGDLSRQAGVGPSIQVTVENEFLSLESDLTTLVLRVTNPSERIVSDVFIEVIVESRELVIIGKRDRQISRLGPQQSTLLAVPLERKQTPVAPSGGEKNISVAISVRASAEGFVNVDLGISKPQVPVRSFEQQTGIDQIPKLFQVGVPLTPSEPGLFHGRSDILEKLRSSFYEGVQRERFFLDGIRRAGKTTVLNFLPASLPGHLMPIHVNLEWFDLSSPVNSPKVLESLCKCIRDVAASGGVVIDVPKFEKDSGHTFGSFLAEFRAAIPDRIPFLMIDEFQLLLNAIARTASHQDHDTLVLDQLRAALDEGQVNGVFTGSIRFDRLSGILKHRIFGSLTRLRVSFLREDAVRDVLEAGMGKWAKLPPETIKRVFELTGGYPWLVQTYGTGLVDLLNRERRTVASPEDAEAVTQEAVLCNNELFAFWWPIDQLGSEEERFIELLLRKYPADQVVSTREFFSSVNRREEPAFRQAFQNLKACEVLDSTQTESLRFGGSVLRQWLERHMHDGHLQIPRGTTPPLGHAGIFIDHENMIHTLKEVAQRRAVTIPTDRNAWLKAVLARLVGEAERRFGAITYRLSVAFWERPEEAELTPSYYHHGFTLRRPEDVKLENAVDFKVADEFRRAREQSIREGSDLRREILITGDGDLTHSARSLVNDGVTVQVWGGSKNTNLKYVDMVGAENVVALDDVCGL